MIAIDRSEGRSSSRRRLASLFAAQGNPSPLPFVAGLADGEAGELDELRSRNFVGGKRAIHGYNL